MSVVIEALASAGILFGGVVPYIPQYLAIKRTQNADGFSTYVCLSLLVANVLRILFWFGRRFELTLLLQSIIMIVCMLLMMHICISVKFKSRSNILPKRFTEFKQGDFWQWTEFSSYVQCLVVFTLISSLVTMLLINSSLYVEFVGLVALLTEALLALPQFLKNYRSKSTEGMRMLFKCYLCQEWHLALRICHIAIMSVIFCGLAWQNSLTLVCDSRMKEITMLLCMFNSIAMVLLWMVGDVFKTVYFLYRAAPMQFVMCGVLQISLDVAILSQVIFYK